MGLNLSGKSVRDHGKKFGTSRRKTFKSPSHSDDENEEVLAGKDSLSEQESSSDVDQKPKVLEVPAFEGGFVHSAFKEAVSANWIKSSESAILLAAIEECLVVDGVAVGLVSARSSFERKQGGSVLF